MSTKKSSDHPTYAKMISSAILTLKDKTGSSRQAIAKFVCANYKVDAAKAAAPLNRALKKGVEDGVLKMAKQSGKGAGSYKLVVKAKKKKPAAKRAKPSVKKSGAGAARKKAGQKPITAKKSKAGKKSGTSKKTEAAKAIIPGKKSVIKKPKVGKKAVKASKKV